MEINELVSMMTLEEKARLLGGSDMWHTEAVERLGIPRIAMSDGPHGLRKQEGSGDNLDLGDSIRAVCFPSAAGLASSFNRDMLRRFGETLGNECRAEHVDILLGPAINIKRSPLCGRNFEYMTEDPYLAGELGTAYVKGVQSKGVGVSVKHFAANNQEKRRMTVSAVVDERTLREIYLYAFEQIVKNAAPDTLMCSYNKINGVYSSENLKLLTYILRDEWGFNGFVMSDWGAVSDRAAGVMAGLDLEMPSSNGVNKRKILEAVESGRLEEEYVDAAAANLLRAIDRYTGFLSGNGSRDNGPEPIFDRVEDHKMARRFARESMVLLKNEGALPLSKERSILFIGEFAKKPRIQGGGSSHINPTRVISAYEAVSRHTRVDYAKGFCAKGDKIEEELISEAVAKAARAEVAVIFAGLPDSFESEGYDREHMRLPQCQNRLIREVAKVQPNTVVVLHNGSPVTMPWEGQVNAILEAYLGGEACGEAVIDILFGVVNPSGKLAETFPLSVKDTPSYDNFPGGQLTVEYRESIFVGYRYYDRINANVLFPFGHGLSYTSFEYSDLEVEADGDSARVSFTVKNTGKYAGAEIAQIYVGRTGSRVFRAPKELKGFEKVFLQPGEEKRLTAVLDRRAFSHYSVGAGQWCVEPGTFQIMVGASSRDIRLRGEAELNTDDEDIRLIAADELPTYFFGDPSAVPDAEFERLLMAPVPDSYIRFGERFTLNNSLEDARDSKWGSRLMTLIRGIFAGRSLLGKDDMLLAAITEMPIHSLICMSGGLVDEEMGEAIINILNDNEAGRSFRLLAAKAAKLAGGRIRAHRDSCK